MTDVEPTFFLILCLFVLGVFLTCTYTAKEATKKTKKAKLCK